MARFTIELSKGGALVRGLEDSQARDVVTLLESHRELGAKRTQEGVLVTGPAGRLGYKQVEDLLAQSATVSEQAPSARSEQVPSARKDYSDPATILSLMGNVAPD